MNRKAILVIALVALAPALFFFIFRPRPLSPPEPHQHVELPAATLPVSSSIPKATSTPRLPVAHERPQFVILSFDGSYSLDMWDKTIAFAKKMREEQKPLSFTYFISGVYFLNYSQRFEYHPPREAAGRSTIGYADGEKDIAARIERVNTAIADGHEMGTHFNGHFDGSTWNREEWESELKQFFDFVFTPSHELAIKADDIKGARAPLLGINREYHHVLQDHAFSYDASATGKPDMWPYKIDGKVWEFPLAQITYIPTGSKILSMDYNFYFKQTGGTDKLTRDSKEWNDAYFAMLNSYKKYFQDNYEGSRAPVIIGHHFSLWNDGVYWDALKQFAWDVCGLPDVQCTTFAEAVKYLEEIETQP